MKIVKLFGYVYDSCFGTWERWEEEAVLIAPDICATVCPSHSDIELHFAMPYGDPESRVYLAHGYLGGVTVPEGAVLSCATIPTVAVPFLLFCAEKGREIPRPYDIPVDMAVAVPA
ncbi:hypothetical protein KQR54_18235 [Mycobacterium gordonae]|nr:hypothetical protein [Mycobacterium gordonae]